MKYKKEEYIAELKKSGNIRGEIDLISNIDAITKILLRKNIMTDQELFDTLEESKATAYEICFENLSEKDIERLEQGIKRQKDMLKKLIKE